MKKLLVLLILLPTICFSQDAWTQLDDFPFETRAVDAFFYENTAYVVVNDSNDGFNSIYEYDASNDVWDFFMQVDNDLEAPFVLGDGVFFVKVLTDTDVEVRRYDFTEDSWQVKNNIVFESIAFFDVPDAESFVLNNEAYVYLAGASGINFQKYDEPSDQWTPAPTLDDIIHGRTQSTVLNNKGYVVFGYDDNSDVLNILYEFDPIAQTWTELLPYPGGYRSEASVFGIGDYIYVGLGDQGGFTPSEFYRYSTSTQIWELIEPCGYMAESSFSFNLDDIGYVGVGSRFEIPDPDETQQYFPQKEVWRLDPELLSIADESKVNLKIYPNPTTDILTINGLQEGMQVSVFDALGRKVDVPLSRKQINTAFLPSGLYFLEVASDRRVEVLKFIKK